MTIVDKIYNRILLAGLEGDDEVRINIASLHYILEAELTAVKGVDELIEKYTELHEAEQMVEAGEVLEDLKDLKQTPVASEEYNIDLGIVNPTELDNLRKPIADYIKSKEKLTSLMSYIIDVCDEKGIRYLPVIPIHDRKITAYCDGCKKYVSVPHDCPSISSYQSSSVEKPTEPQLKDSQPKEVEMGDELCMCGGSDNDELRRCEKCKKQKWIA